MVVKEGYKNTEVGVIPEDWEVKKQMDIVKYINGRAYSIHEWETQGVPVVRLQNLTNKGGDFYYSQLKLPEYQYMYKGDLIYMWSASFGPYIWWGDKAIFHYHIWRIECDKMKIDKSFYYYKLIEITEELKKGTSGSTMLHLTKGFMENYLVPLPSTVFEQIAIATVLSDTDNLIQALEKKIAKKELIKKGAMQELLEPKEGWEVKRIGEVFMFKQGVQCAVEKQSKEWQKGLKKFIRIIDLTQKEEPPRYIADPGNAHHIKKDDLFMVRYGNPGLLGYGYEGVIANNLFSLKPLLELYPLFFYYLLTSKQDKILELSSSTTMAAVNFTSLKNLEVIFPKSKSEQTHIAQILSDMDTEIESLQEKLLKYRQLKQGLMQELLTGRIRLV